MQVTYFVPSETVGRLQTPKSLKTLADAIATTHKDCVQTRLQSWKAASKTMEAAYLCGHYLRLAKKQIKHGEFQRWVRRTLSFTPRTAQRYMQFHEWAKANEKALASRNPRTLRQAYCLAGIISETEEESSAIPLESQDIKKIRRYVRRLCVHFAATREYIDPKVLQRALEPVKVALVQVYTNTDFIEKRPTVSFLQKDDSEFVKAGVRNL